ncbi:MAG TPA: class I SAM-dependent methyltransferase [Ktedonobacterales bacterium]|nr:class I SAM-dependent methyltransferase [Ktedonobacterales bacterium]
MTGLEDPPESRIEQARSGAKIADLRAHLLDVLNHASQALFISIGHKTGLIDTLARLPACTSEQLAKEARLNERYVREWLGAMVVSGLVEYDPPTRTYVLPRDHAVVLTGMLPSMVGMAQVVPVLLALEPAIVDCFRAGGGLPYSALTGFKSGVAVGPSTADAGLLETTLPQAPGLVDRLRSGVDIAEIGCGDGHRLNVMADAFPHSRFTGYDFSTEGIAKGNAEAAKLELTNAHFELLDLARLDTPDAFDVIIGFDAIHDLAQPRTVLQNVYAALRAGGTFFMDDVRTSSSLENNIGHPLGPLIYLWSLTHCMPLSLAQNGEGLGAAWGVERATEYLRRAGFQKVEVKVPDGELIHCIYVCTKE